MEVRSFVLASRLRSSYNVSNLRKRFIVSTAVHIEQFPAAGKAVSCKESDSRTPYDEPQSRRGPAPLWNICMVRSLGLILLFMSATAAHAGDDGAKVASAKRERAHARSAGNSLPLVKETLEYYEIKGNSEAELQDQLRANGVRWQDGKIYDSLTTWEVDWKYGHASSPDACVADAVQTSVAIRIRYPRWVRDAQAPPALVEKWDRYLESLVEHESGHRDMAVEAAADLARAISTVQPSRHCAELDQTVARLCTARMKQLKQDAEEYDASTDHGGLQGAVLE